MVSDELLKLLRKHLTHFHHPFLPRNFLKPSFKNLLLLQAY